MKKLEFATQRLIDSVWTVAFVRVDGGVEVLAFSRNLVNGYKNEHELPRMNFVEDEERTVTELHLEPYRDFVYAATQPTERLKVVNPKNIFAYGDKYFD